MRNHYIDVAKVIFSITIVTTHLFLLGYDRNYGFLAVEFFFFASGFFMMRSIAKRKDDPVPPGRFIYHKIAIFFPLFISAEIIALAFRSYVGFSTEGLTTPDFFTIIVMSINELLFLQMSNIPCYCGIGIGWYFSAMILGMCILYPIALQRPNYSSTLAPAIAVILLGLIYTYIGTLDIPDALVFGVPSGLIRGIADMCLGMFGFTCCERLRNTKLTSKGSILLTIIVVVMIIITVYYMVFGKDAPYQFITIIMLWCIVVIAASDKCLVFVKEGTRTESILSHFGTISLLLLLNHYYIFDCIARLYPDDKPVLLVYSTITILLCVIACYCLSKVLTRIMNSIKKICIETDHSE